MIADSLAIRGQQSNLRQQRIKRYVRFLAWRLSSAALVVFLSLTIAFLTIRFLPGNTLETLLGDTARKFNAEQAAAAIEQLGLNKPFYVQYSDYLYALAHGDLGVSYYQRAPVSSLILGQIGATIQLAFSALALAWLISLTFVVLTAGRSAFLDGSARFIEVVMASIPQFWLGLVLLLTFSIGLHWLPIVSGTSFKGLILPAITLALPLAGLLSQFTRGAFDENLSQPFILSSRARGASDLRVRFVHALRHSITPAVTMTGQSFGSLLGGALVVEEIFARQGIGQVIFKAINSRDLPLVLGIVIIVALLYVLINLVVDILQTFIDPRILKSERS